VPAGRGAEGVVVAHHQQPALAGGEDVDPADRQIPVGTSDGVQQCKEPSLMGGSQVLGAPHLRMGLEVDA